MGIDSIYLASSGERITRLDQLQDIDELYVVEVRRGGCQLAPGGCPPLRSAPGGVAIVLLLYCPAVLGRYAGGRGGCWWLIPTLMRPAVCTCPPACSLQGAAPRGGQASAAGPAADGNGYLQTQPTSYVSRLGVADAEISAAMNSRLAADADQSQKYAKRQGSLQRTMKRVFPSLFQGSLPVTNK